MKTFFARRPDTAGGFFRAKENPEPPSSGASGASGLFEKAPAAYCATLTIAGRSTRPAMLQPRWKTCTTSPDFMPSGAGTIVIA